MRGHGALARQIAIALTGLAESPQRSLPPMSVPQAKRAQVITQQARQLRAPPATSQEDADPAAPPDDRNSCRLSGVGGLMCLAGLQAVFSTRSEAFFKLNSLLAQVKYSCAAIKIIANV